MGAVQAVCQFSLLVSQQNHSDPSLKALDDALKQFHQMRGIFQEQKMLKSAKGKVDNLHQQKSFPSGRNGCVRVDTLGLSRQRHRSGGLLCTRRQYHVSHLISPSDLHFAVSFRSVGLSF